MSSSCVPAPSDMKALRQYVTAKDGQEYQDAHDDTVVLSFTHSQLKRRLAELRVSKHLTIGELKHKIHRHCGTKVDFMHLTLCDFHGQALMPLNEPSRKLGFYPIEHSMVVHVRDDDPYSLAKDGGLEDVSQIKKFELTEEQYDQRQNTVRQYKRDQLAKDPNWKPPTLRGAGASSGPTTPPAPPATKDSVDGMKSSDRCQVMPGARRGTIAFVGEIPHLGTGGYWVGVKFDEPVGKCDGTFQGTRYFTCPPKYGGFIRPQNLTVGDFPEEDPLASSSSSEEEEEEEL